MKRACRVFLSADDCHWTYRIEAKNNDKCTSMRGRYSNSTWL